MLLWHTGSANEVGVLWGCGHSEKVATKDGGGAGNRSMALEYAIQPLLRKEKMRFFLS